MKKFIIVIVLALMALLCTGCKEKEFHVPVLSDIQEKVIEETITLENVLIESWT